MRAAVLVAATCCVRLAAAQVVDAVEFHHAVFDHYFVTANPAEVTALDNGSVLGWVRTGQSFKVDSQQVANTFPVCRFFSDAFGARASHFHTVNVAECDAVKRQPAWQYEGVAFYARLPFASGTCPSDTQKVYRLYNNGKSGAPNHRYTTSYLVRAIMIHLGWSPEGPGEGIAYCAGDVAASANAYARTLQLIGGTWTLTYTFDGQVRNDRLRLTEIDVRDGDLPYFVNGVWGNGENTVTGGWSHSLSQVVLVATWADHTDVYRFEFTSESTVSGCYQREAGGPLLACQPLTGSRQ